MNKKLRIFMVILMALAFLAGCTSDSQVADDVQEPAELTFMIITEFNVYTNEEISVLLFEEIINSSSDLWGFMVLEPSQPIQESTFIQVGASWADTAKFNLEIGFGNAETGFRLYRFITEDKNVVLQYFVDYWQEQIIPDISLWEDVSVELGVCSWENISYEHLEFHTPEDAVIAYLEGLRDSDLNRMVEALPDDLPEGIYAGEIIGDFIAHLNWLLEQFQSPLSPSEFQSLEVLGFVPPEMLDERYASELNQENLSNMAERAGVEQFVSRVVLFELGGETYMLTVNVADVGGEWRVADFGGTIGALLFIAPQMQGLVPPEFVDEFLGEIDLESVMTLP